MEPHPHRLVDRRSDRGRRRADRNFTDPTDSATAYATQLLAELEGLERGPAGNTSLAAALSVARELPSEALVVVQETEYTGAGKHPWLEYLKCAGCPGCQKPAHKHKSGCHQCSALHGWLCRPCPSDAPTLRHAEYPLGFPNHPYVRSPRDYFMWNDP